MGFHTRPSFEHNNETYHLTGIGIPYSLNFLTKKQTYAIFIDRKKERIILTISKEKINIEKII